MALSGTLNTNAYQGRYLQFTWEATQSIANNTSAITWTLKGAGEGSSSWYYAAPFTVKIDGTTVYTSSTRIQLAEGTVVAKKTKTLEHNSNGTKSFTVEVEGAIYEQTINCSGSKTFTLNQIARAATITSAPNFDDTDNPTIIYNNPGKGNVDSVEAGIYGTDGLTTLAAYRAISRYGTSYTFSLTDTERIALQKYCNTSNSTIVRFYLRTTIGNNTYFSRAEKTLTIVDGSATLSPTVTDANDLTYSVTGDRNTIVRNFSHITFDNGEVARKQATINSREVKVGAKSATTASGRINNVGSNVFNFSVTDSRGNTTTETVTKNLVDYVKLTCNLSASTVLEDDNSVTVNFDVSGNYFNDTFGAVDNTLSLWARYKADNEEYSDWGEAYEINIVDNSYNVSGKITNLDYTKSYTVQIRAQDELYKAYGNYVYSKAQTVTTLPVFDWSKDDFNFNVPVHFNSGITIDGITVGCGVDTSLTNTTQKLPMSTLYNSCGSAFTQSDGGIKCERDGYVLVSGCAHVLNLTNNDAVSLQLTVNSTNYAQSYTPTPRLFVTATLSPRILQVSAGDVIYLSAYNYDGSRGTVRANNSTILTATYVG